MNTRFLSVITSARYQINCDPGNESIALPSPISIAGNKPLTRRPSAPTHTHTHQKPGQRALIKKPFQFYLTGYIVYNILIIVIVIL